MIDSDFFSNRWFTRVPAANIKENEKEYLIEIAVPGMSKNDFEVKIEDDLLIISAEKEEKKDEKEGDYTRREYSYNSFNRSFRLPDYVDYENIQGIYEDGVLKFSIPKKEPTVNRPKKEIKIK